MLLKIIHSAEVRTLLAENEEQLSRLAEIRRQAQQYLADVYRIAKAPVTSFYEKMVAHLAGNRQPNSL